MKRLIKLRDKETQWPGSGKSTVSVYFYDREDDKYRDCDFESPHISHFQVFNQEYIDSKFARTDYQPGSFTLSKAYEESLDQITHNNKERARLSACLDKLNEEIAEKNAMKTTITGRCAHDIFNRTVNDRKSLNDFLDGARIRRSFYDRMMAIPLSVTHTTTEALAEKWRTLSQSEGTLVAEVSLPSPSLSVRTSES